MPESHVAHVLISAISPMISGRSVRKELHAVNASYPWAIAAAKTCAAPADRSAVAQA